MVKALKENDKRIGEKSAKLEEKERRKRVCQKYRQKKSDGRNARKEIMQINHASFIFIYINKY